MVSGRRSDPPGGAAVEVPDQAVRRARGSYRVSRSRPDDEDVVELVEALAKDDWKGWRPPALFTLVDDSNTVSANHHWSGESKYNGTLFNKWFKEYFRKNKESWSKAKGVIYRKEGSRSTRFNLVLSDKDEVYCLVVDVKTGHLRWMAWDTAEAEILLEAMRESHR